MKLPTNTKALDELKAQLSGSGLDALLEQIRTWTLLIDAQGGLIAWNPAFDGMRERVRKEGRLQKLLEASDAAAFQQSLITAREGAGPVHLELGIGAEGERMPCDCVLIRLSDDRLLLLAEPVTEVRGQEIKKLRAELRETKQALNIKQQELQAVVAQAEEVAHTDALTFLPNRRAIVSEVQRQVTYSERYGTPLSVSMIDLDNFKEVNDTYGHPGGDQVLRFIASELRDRIRQPDEIGRYGGDEFLMILPNTSANAAAEQATRLCAQVWSTTIVPGRPPIQVSLSIGIAQYQSRGDNWHALIERADQALYKAKSDGRKRWAILKS